jgi:pimeloyl-ACP methyl ester carboxylesterase
VKEARLSQGTVRYRDSGSGPVVVLVHGLLVSGTLWDEVASRLSGSFRCIVPDLPLGSHQPAMEPDADLSPPGLARLVADLMDELELRDVTLVGNDTGGAVCQLVAAHHPERVARLVLASCDTYDDFLPAMFRPLQWIARVPPVLTAALQPTRIGALHNTPLAFGLLTKRAIPRETTTAWLRPSLSDAGVRRDLGKVLRGIDPRFTNEAAERLRGFERPALFAWAGEDKVFKLANAERLAGSMPDATVVQIPDSRTFVSLDAPDRTAELIGDFAGG